MADLISIMQANTRIKCNKAEFLAFQQELDEENQRLESEDEVELDIFLEFDPDDGLLIYSDNFGDDCLSDGFLAALGKLLAANGLEYLEFTYSYRECPILGSGEMGSEQFRIDVDGRVLKPRLVWD